MNLSPSHSPKSCWGKKVESTTFALIYSRVLANGSSKNEHVSQRDSIKSCFESMRCFLMPHPGETVDTSDKFRGELSGTALHLEFHRTLSLFRVSSANSLTSRR